MKKIIFFLTFLLTACQNPVADFVLGFKEPIETGSLRIQFNRPEEGKVPAGLQFFITGPDADKMVNHLNAPKFKITDEGVVVVAIVPDITPTPEDPVEFTVVAEAPGYLKVVKSFRYTARSNRTFSAQLVKQDQSGALTTRQIEIDRQPLVEVQNGTEKLELRFPQNNRLYDENGTPLSGPHDLALISYAAGSALSRVPGGTSVAKPLDANGKPLENPFSITRVAGMVSLEMSSKNHQVVKGFELPLQAVMVLDPKTQNPDTGKPVQEGDVLRVLSYDTDAAVWKVEGETPVRRNAAGLLYSEFSVPHLSYWLAGWTREICANGPRFRVSSAYTDLDISYLAQLVNARDGSLVREYYISLNNTRQLTISLLPAMDDDVKLVVFDYNNYHGGDRNKTLATSAAVPVCETQVVDLPAVKPTVPKALSIVLDNSCPNGSTIPDHLLPAQLRIQFSEPGKNSWRDAGTLTRTTKTAVTYRLLMGQRYDLRGSTDGGVSWPYQTLNAHINKAHWPAELRELGLCK